jgi:hypothetical protein
MQAQAASFVNSALDSVKSTSSTAISITQSTIANSVDTMKTRVTELQGTAASAVNEAVDRVKSEVNSIVDTLDNLSAQMCESQCTSFFNLPCFLLFRCSDKIKRFCLAILLPIVLFIVLFIGCNTGLINFPCLCKLLQCITGITCIIWCINRRRQKQEEEREQQVKKDKSIKFGKSTPVDNPEEECPQTEKQMRMND